MNIFFIGMGYMGVERLKNIISLKKKYNLNICGFYDPKIKTVKLKGANLKSEKNFSKFVLDKKKVDLCFISVPHNLSLNYSLICCKSEFNPHLVIEKPFGLNLSQSKKIIKAKKKTQQIYVGLNYRFYNGISNMLRDIKNKRFGKINSLLINFGHGHNPSIKSNWKLNKKLAGGGVILDPGIHIFNLINLFCSKLKINYVKKLQNFWKTGVEEEVSVLLSSKQIPLINITLSITRWRSTFEINGNGNKGYWRLSGRGRSYGAQKYLVGERWGWMKAKNQKLSEKLLSNSNEKKVFLYETESIIRKILNLKVYLDPCNDKEALKTMQLIKKIYEK